MTDCVTVCFSFFASLFEGFNLSPFIGDGRFIYLDSNFGIQFILAIFSRCNEYSLISRSHPEVGD